MSRFFSWFSTSKGKKFTHFCVGGAALFLFGNHIAVRGPFLDKVIDILQAYRDGKPRPLPDEVHSLINEVLRDSKLKQEEKRKLKFFYITGHEIFHSGAVDSPWGAAIGIPFTFQHVENIDFGQLKLQGRTTVDWLIDGQDLIQALKLSDKAKKFALMREIYSSKISEILQNAAISALCLLIPARLAQVSNTRKKAFETMSLRQRVNRYLILYVCGFVLYRLVKDPTRHLSDAKADRLAAETSPEYLDGGIEYYEKRLMRNKAFNELLKSKFWRNFDDHGNEYYLIFPPKLPFTKRLENLQKMKGENLSIEKKENSQS